MRFVYVAMTVIALLPTGFRAQQSYAHPELDLAVTYSAQRGTAVGGSSFWAQGGSAELSATVYHGLGGAMDIAGNRASNISPSGVGLTMITTTFGPRYTWSHTLRGEFQKRISLFGQTLIGEAHGLDSTFPSPAAAQSDANVFALQTGGGVDLAFSRHFAIRPLEANWLRTQFPNGASNIQNSLRFGSGLVFRLP